MKKALNLILGLLIVFATVFGVSAISVDISKVEVNDYTVTSTSLPLLVDRSNTLNINVWFSSDVAHSDVQVMAFLSGYEYGNIQQITPVFDIQPGVEYEKTLVLSLPQILSTGDYKLRIIFADKDGTIADSTYEYNLYVDTQRHNIALRNVMLIPGSVVKQGDSLLTALRLENLGQKDESDVEVISEIPKLGVKQVSYVDNIKAGQILSTDYMMLNIPNCAKPGKYDLVETVKYDRGMHEVTKTEQINVLASGACEATTASNKTTSVISVGPKLVSVKPGENALYSVTLQNTGNNQALYELNAIVPGNWASVIYSPGKTVVLNPGEQKTVYVTVTPKSNVEGPQMFDLVVKSNGQQKSVALQTIVSGTSSTTTLSSEKTLQISLIILIVIVVILGIIITVAKSSKKEEEDKKDKDETYY